MLHGERAVDFARAEGVFNSLDVIRDFSQTCPVEFDLPPRRDVLVSLGRLHSSACFVGKGRSSSQTAATASAIRIPIETSMKRCVAMYHGAYG